MRVLIATVTAGAGHMQAAAALEEAWRALRPGDDLKRLDVLDFTSRLYRKTYVDGYAKLVKHAPDLWALMYQKADNPSLLRRISRLRRTLALLPTGRFAHEVKRFAHPRPGSGEQRFPARTRRGGQGQSRGGSAVSPRRLSTLPPKATGLERGVDVASSFERPSGNVSPTPIER